MKTIKDFIEVQEFAISNGFTIQISSNDAGEIDTIVIEYGDRELQYRVSDGGIFIADIKFNGNFEDFVAELNLLRVIEKIGNMLKESMNKE